MADFKDAVDNNQEQKIEKVGEVVLDLTYYPGEDYYSDGDIEDDILDIVKNNSKEAFPKIIEERKSWPVFYHLSSYRSNIIDWIPFKKTDKVLEIGSGCGAITGAVAAKAGSVTCIDLSKKRSLVNAYRNKSCDNITIMVGNFKDIEPQLSEDYDYVLLIGVFEYGQAYIGGSHPYEDFMKICNRHRKDNGRLVIAIENKFGLKYWAGCREDHLGTYFSGLEGYHEGGVARTFTRHGFEKILSKAGISEYAFYYPYPDYKFMTTIYSDKYLPKKGELSNNLRNFDRDRLLLFDEKQVFDQIIEEKEFPLFSNSYLLVIGSAPNIAYARFSNDRDEAWKITTTMVEEKTGALHIEKMPCSDKSQPHIEKTKRAYELLSKRYENTKIDINKCVLVSRNGIKGLAFEFCKGVTLEALLDACLAKNDIKGFKVLIDEYLKWLAFGEESSDVSNLDFIFPNIIVERDKWHVIDYEWTVEKKISSKDIAFRAFYNYILGSEIRKEQENLLFKDILHYTDKEIADAIEDERKFQKMITGDKVSVNGMRDIIGNKAYELKSIEASCTFTHEKFAVQIFYDRGNGFSEEDSFKIRDCFDEYKFARFEFDVPEDVVRVRIDPCAFCCSVGINRLSVGDRLYTNDVMEINGSLQESGYMVFDTVDPNIVISVAGGKRLSADIEVCELPQMLAKQIVDNSKNMEEIELSFIDKLKNKGKSLFYDKKN